MKKTLKRLFNYTFKTTPKTMIEMVQFNSDRIGVLTVLIMIMMVILTFTGQLPSWSFIIK